MRTTVTIADDLLVEVKLLAARTHRTIGAVLEDALRQAVRAEQMSSVEVVLPDFGYNAGLQGGVDLYDRDLMAGLLHAGPDGHALS